ncbi:MAG: hypothetical protein ACTSPV_01255 [Candidatus Hodarchaeales archaeon]
MEEINEELKKQIEINLRNVEEGKPLTVPLAVLNGEFKREYNKRTGANINLTQSKPYRTYKEWKFEGKCVVCGKKFKSRNPTRITCSKECYNERMRKYRKEYNQRPEVKKRVREYRKEYYQRPEVKERMRKYYQRPEVKKRKRKYHQRPEVKKRKRKYMKEYNQRPEVKKRMREYNREYYRKRKNKLLQNV